MSLSNPVVCNLRAENEKLKQQIKELKNENKTLKQQNSTIRDLKVENADLKQQKRELINENKILQKNIEVLFKLSGFSKNKRKRDLQLENETIHIRIQELEHLNKDLQDSQTSNTKEIQQQNEVMQEMFDDIRELQSKKAGYVIKVKGMEKDNQSLRKENDVMIKRMCEMKRDFEKEKDDMQQQIQAVKNELHQAKTAFKELQESEERKRIMNEENKTTNSAQLRQTLELQCFAHEIDILRQHNELLEQDLQELSKRSGDCQKELKPHDEGVKGESRMFKATEKDSEHYLNVISREKELLCHECEALKRELEEVKKNLCDVQEAMKAKDMALQTQAQTPKVSQEEHNSVINNYDVQVNALLQQNKALENKVSDLTKKVWNGREAMRQMKKNFQEQRQLLENLRGEFEEF
ncbi:daple-like protein [Oreochromis niloticus]|uniref:daple-like protein n=1 Tax=Oreochromis niloticus TaxID=8128 RepID=UPI000905722D|nr:daple-like protein [Oreochromis niloticus]